VLAPRTVLLLVATLYPAPAIVDEIEPDTETLAGPTLISDAELAVLAPPETGDAARPWLIMLTVGDPSAARLVVVDIAGAPMTWTD
jgi:hypothetical protein